MDSTCGNKDLNSLICELSECGFSSGSAPTPPKTIQKYYETIEKNNKASVLHVEEEPEELTYCISGRGRGGKRTYMAPGGQISRTLYGKESLAFNNDINEELRQNIRAKPTVQLKAIARPAPYILKPFAGLYNPYPHGCSFLCNHPTDHEAREILRKAKDSWAHDGKNVLLQEEIEAIRANLQEVHFQETHITKNTICIPQVDSIPEELFRRYTDTDSRPLTPAPTLASGATRISGSRRCVTPDPIPTNQIRERTLLILDLRRSHSQDTLSYYGSSSLQEPPLIKISHVPTRAGSLEEAKTEYTQHSVKSLHSLPVQSKRPKSGAKNKTQVSDSEAQTSKEKDEKKDNEEHGDEDEFIKRRGKKRRKKGRDTSGGPSGFQASMDPETQVATIGEDSCSASARPSLIPGNSSQDILENSTGAKSLRPSKSLDIDSYLDAEILKQLRRELNEEVVDNELNFKRRKALEEALKTVSKDKIRCEGLINLQKELKLPSVNSDLWMSLPRTFTRSSARFELPMDSRTLSTMKPLDYVKEHISISSPRKLLYNCIFNKFKMEADLENEFDRKLSGKALQESLDLMMGRAMTETQAAYFKELLGWKEEDIFDFKTFCGICALCERMFAPEYVPQLPDRKTDPCHEIETADFEVLERKLSGQTVDERIVKILNGIKLL